jgi:hypothetical protein
LARNSVCLRVVVCHHEKMRNPKVLIVITLLNGLISGGAQAAISLDITNRQYLDPAIQATLDTVADTLENNFNTLFTSTGSTEFLTEMGNANAGATRSIMVPGTSENARYTASFGLNGALSGGTAVTAAANTLPGVGLAAHGGISLSANGEIIKLFRGLDAKRVMYHLSFYSLDLSSYFSASGIEMDSLQVSAAVSYQIYHTESWLPIVRFNGIRVASGLSYGSFNASYTAPFTLSSGGVNMNSDITLTSNSKIYTWSNQVVTGVHLLSVLDFYTGLGIDFNFGSTSLDGSSENGAVSAKNGAGASVFSGDATIAGSANSAAPTILQMRYLLGTQMNLGPLGVFLTGQISTPTVLCLNFGAKLAF